jgi:predicted dehydrogenase
MSTKPLNVGVVGCGNISKTYLGNASKFDAFQIDAVADLDMERAKTKAAEFKIPRALTTEQLLADPAIDVVLDLTIPQAHYPVAKAALEHGKSVFNEKPLCVSTAEGRELQALAAKKGLRIGCAPDTFLGEGMQTCRRLLDAGRIGTPIGLDIMFYMQGPKDPNHFLFKKGGGVLFDMGVYYLTAMVALLGPVERLAATTKTRAKKEMLAAHPDALSKMEVATHVTAAFDFASGVNGAFNIAYDVCGWYDIHFKIHGTEGTLICPDPNMFGGEIVVWSFGKELERLKAAGPFSENSRGLGLNDMCQAIVEKRPHRANDTVALHTLDIMNSVMESSEKSQYIQLATTMERPAAMPAPAA